MREKIRFTSKITTKIIRKIARYWLLLLLIILLLSGGAIYISNSTDNRWQALWSDPHKSNLPLCLAPTKVTTMTSNLPNRAKRLEFKPFRLVVEPWRGEHNVYAVFAVPLAYYEIYYRSMMQVEGTKKGWDATIADAKGMRVEAPEGHFLMVSFFPTRLSIWYWLTGKFANLQDPCNWTLYIYP